MREIVVVIGAGSMGQAIARRVGAGRTVLLADLRQEAAEAAASVLADAGYTTATALVDVADGDSVAALAVRAAGLGAVTHVIHTAGLSPSQASAEAIIAVDLVGTGFVLEEFGKIVAPGGAGMVIASQAGHMIPALPADQHQALSRVPARELAALPFLQGLPNSGAAYTIAKRANVLRVQAAAIEWGDRGARVNALSPGIIMTPLARDELAGPNAEGYQEMIAASVAKRVGTPDEVAEAAAFLMGATFVTGTDLLIDGGVIASMAAGRYPTR
ncbi:MAG TPA: SDR family oxidoreductase [Micropruina sp.]|nr:SDR family oxidoreductase [Micropruina sp.]